MLSRCCRTGFPNRRHTGRIWPAGDFIWPPKFSEQFLYIFLDIKYCNNTSKSAPSDFDLGSLFQSIPMYNREIDVVVYKCKLCLKLLRLVKYYIIFGLLAVNLQSTNDV